MWHKKKIFAGVLVLLAVYLGIGHVLAAPPVNGSSGYDYSHKLSSDYIYRTERVVSGVDKAEGFNPVSTLRRERRGMKKAAEISSAQDGASGPATIETDLRRAVRDLVDQLLQTGGDENVSEHVVAVSTFVNLNHLYRTSALGRYLSEQLISELHEAGVRVIEVRKTPGLMISEEYGEYALSRDMDELSYVHRVDAVVAGTYTFVDDRIYINARLLNNGDGMVLASASYESAIGPIISGMLADEAMPARRQRPIEVRVLGD